jgi:prolyl-tRNA editing enzyme YbaK/EbsC (Cys-tRNA(Pro) deacylase)
VPTPISCAKRQALPSAAYLAHTRPPIVLIDETLLRFDNIWAAASTPNAVFRLTPADLVALTGGLVVDVANG